MAFRWVPAGKLKVGDLLYPPACTFFEIDVMLRDAADAVANVRVLGDGRVEVATVDKGVSDVVLALTAEYEADEFVPVVDEATVEAWIEAALEELTCW